MNVRFNTAFKACNSTKARYRVLLGGAGSGKSVNVAQDYILKLIDPTYKGCSLLVIRSVETSHINSTYAELLGAMHRMGLAHLFRCTTTPLHIQCTLTGNEVVFRGCNDTRAIERLKSVTVRQGKISWIWIEEATELKQSDFEILDDRLRGKLPPEHYYQITLTFNPVNANSWIKRTLWDTQDSNIFKLKTTLFDNAFIDEEYKRRMLRRKETDPEGYSIYALGNWGETGGLIFTNYIIGDYKSREFDTLTIGADWGYNHATALLLVGWYDGNPYIIKEVVCRERTTPEILELCEQANLPKDIIIYADSAEPDRIKAFKQAGYKIQAVKKEPNSVNNSIQWLKSRCIYIDGECVNTQKEIQGYKWLLDRSTGLYLDTPVPVFDDCIAGLRYSAEPLRKANGLKTISKGVLTI